MAATARAEYRNLDGALAAFFRDSVGQYVTTIAQDIVNETTDLLNNGLGPAGVRVRTGRLKSSIEQRVTLSGRRVTIHVGTRVSYARPVHDGRGPVRPKNAKALRWTTPGGQVVVRKSAGPARARPFLLAGTKRALAKHGVSLSVNVTG